MASLSLEGHSAADAYWELVNWYSFQSAAAVETCLAAYISLFSFLHKYVSRGDVSYILGDVMPTEKRSPFHELTEVTKPSAENKDAGEAKVEEDEDDEVDIDIDVDVDHGNDDDDDDSSDGEDEDDDDSDSQGSDNEDSDDDDDDDSDDDEDDDDEDDEDEEEEEEEESNQPPYKSKK